MTGEENPDPLGEYVRVCPYCGDQFTAGHMNRQFCPEKNGYIDYCKNRYKRLAKEYLHSEETIISEEPEDYKDENEISIKVESPLMINIRIMEEVLQNHSSKKLSLYYLSNLGVTYASYDGRYVIPDTELNVLTYGPYALAWGYENQLILTHKNQLSWIQ